MMPLQLFRSTSTRLAARFLGCAGAMALLGTNPAAAGRSEVPELRLNDIQMVGSHNSYRTGIAPAILAYLGETRRDAVHAFRYGNPPLASQLALGIRQIELDTFADPQGGRFADPMGERIAPSGLDRKTMAQPGFKVMHIPGLDYAVNCATLVACLEDVRDWSLSNPRHSPVFITIDSKDYPFSFPGAIVPLRLSPELLDDLDREIRSVFPPNMLITPDDVRGSSPTLRGSVLHGGWPSLAASRGKVMIIFDVGTRTADSYRRGHPSLRGRAMFSLYPETDAEAATIIVQNPRASVGHIQKLVKQGFIVRTRSDADMVEGRRQDFTGWHAARNSGAQMISTDYSPRPGGPAPASFRFSFPGGELVRCNPVRVPGNCPFRQDPPLTLREPI